MVHLPIQFQGSFGETILEAFFDENLSFSLVCEATIKSIATPIQKPNSKMVFNELTGFSIVTDKTVCLDFLVNGLMLSDEFLVVENLSTQVIFGATTLRKWRIKLDISNNALLLNPQVAQFRL